jgi:thioredoxin-related protein
VNRFMLCMFSFVSVAMACLVSGSASAELPSVGAILRTPDRMTDILWHDNLDSGWRESQRTGRPMVIFITSSHCRFCDAMKQATWHDLGIENRVGKDFVAVRLCPEQNAKELSRIQIDVYPTTIVALPQGKVVDHRKGFQPPELLHNLLNRVVQRRPG